jgi:Leucine-rich repeat (LRR) protein
MRLRSSGGALSAMTAAASVFLVVAGQQVSHALSDREILEKFFDAAGGKQWIHQHKWKESDNVCNWYGIVCDDELPPDGLQEQDDDTHDVFDDDDGDDDGTRHHRALEQAALQRRRRAAAQRWTNRAMKSQDDDDGRDDHDDDGNDDDNVTDDGNGKTAQSGAIKAIRLGGNGLNGTLASEMFDIASLAELDVKDNPDLKVNLDGIGKLKLLETLYLSDVNMKKEDLAGIGEATALRELHLTNNGFGGSIPEELFDLTLLDALFIAFNNFEGDFPKGLYAMNLTEFWAYDNLFSGKLPDDLDSGMPQLRHLVLGGNAFTGTIPEAFTKLIHLRQLSIRNLLDTLELAGPGLSGTIPSFHTQRHIKALHLNHNNFTGTIPTNLLNSIEYKHKTLSVNLTHNMLTGVVPEQLKHFTKLELDVTANRLTGFADGLCNDDGSFENANLTDWLDGRVGDFGCDAILCPANSASDLGRAENEDIQCNPCELPDGFAEWDDDGIADDDDDKINDDDDGGDRRLRGRREFQRRMQNNNTDTPPDVTPYWGKIQCEYKHDDGTIVDKTGDEVADLDGYGDERAILTELYNALGGDNWDYKDHWLDDDKGICVWYGITCGIVDGPDAGNNAVERINLDGNGLVGDLPKSVYNLPDLKELSVMRNDITFTFENIQNATELENLFLEGIKVTSLDGVEKATGLKKLILSDLALSGPFPTNLYGLERLQELMLDDNELTGTLPKKISSWKKMTRFDVTRNKLEGQLPSFRKMPDLRVLDLSNNGWTGTLPESLADMEKLEVLAIYGGGSGGGDGIGGPLLDFADCPDLMEIYLEDNQLTGTISHQFLASNDKKNRTIYVALSRNMLNGTVPAELSKFDRMTITLDGNLITEIAPEVCAKKKWMEGEVEQYGCDAILCPAEHYHSEIGRATKLLGGCGACPALMGDPILGNTMCGDGNVERDILTKLFTATGGPQWNEKSNWLDNTMGICEWYGVTCRDEENDVQSGVIRLELMDNGLVGSVFSDLYKMPMLNEIDFDKNPGLKVNFEGVKASESLQRFRMSGTQVDMTNIDQAKHLQYIDCANAGLSGPLPDALFNMPQLVSLELTSNALTGHITHHIEKWTNLTDLYLDHNQFSGTLTTHIGKLTSLKEFAVSRNRLQGPLPKELNKLVNLELFGAKDQKDEDGLPTLNGTMPSFHDSPNLNEIFLGQNALSGDIPSNLLESSQARTTDAYIVYVGLDKNRLTGTIPEGLGGIKTLILDVNDNFIEHVPKSLCDNDTWQNGGVGLYGCDAILCPKGHYLEPTGRQVKPDSTCQKCNVVGGASFMGSTSCLSMSEVVGRPILKEVYQALRGEDWWNNENWLEDNKDVCEWHGVNCTSDKIIEGIYLGSNNLQGQLPEDFWQIPGLTTVWMYSNPTLDITFVNAHKATKLKTLLIDATGLTSIEGLGQAPALEELDLRFNNLQGTFPYGQISELTNLKVLSLANSNLQGKLNSYGLGEKKHLEKLRLGGNQFTGELPDFSTFPAMEHLDLSDNFFDSEVPAAFLSDVNNTSKHITVDLASNQLHGVVPSEPFERFDKLTLFLRGNLFEGINQQLCDKKDWNDGSVGLYGCNGLLCPAHTYASSGRQRTSDELCEQCDLPTAFYAGAVECAVQASSARVPSSAMAMTRPLSSGAFIISMVVGLLGFAIFALEH